MRMERIESALLRKEWGALADCYSDEQWASSMWTKPQMISFARAYVEPLMNSNSRVKHTENKLIYIPVRSVSLVDTSGKTIVSMEQAKRLKLLWSSANWQAYIPLGWSEECPSSLNWIRQVSQVLYPHPEVKDRFQAGAVSEFEFMLAEKKKLIQIGLTHLIPARPASVARAARPARTIDDYLNNQRRAYRKVWAPFAKVEAKYQGSLAP